MRPKVRFAYAIYFLMLGLLIGACRAPSSTPISSSGAVVSETSRPPSDSVAQVPQNLFVAEEGLYTLSLADGEQTAVVHGPEGQMPTLLHNGRLYFWGTPSTSLYSAENVYRLTFDDAPLDFPIYDATPEQADAPLAFYQQTITLEENRLYEPEIREGEHWFWAYLPAPNTFETTFQADAVAPDAEGTVQITFYAVTDAPSLSPDHHVRVFINDTLVAEATWDGKGAYTLEGTIPAGVVRDGENSLRVELPGDLEVIADILYLNAITLTYPRRFVLGDSPLVFTAPSTGVVHVEGVEGTPLVLDLSTTPPSRLDGFQYAARTLTVRVEAGHRYALTTLENARPPTRMAPLALQPDLRAIPGADYIAIGPQDLLDAAQPLLDYRRSQGLIPQAIPVDAVYDQFGNGLPEPDAIRAFVQYAAENWSPAPRFLLLIGDATYDPRGYITPPEANRVPTFLIWTTYGGETATDLPFADIDDDGIPDIAVGRIPARTPEQVQTVVQKTLRFEQARVASTTPRVLAVADGREPRFADDAQSFLDLVQPAYQTDLYRPAPDTPDADVPLLNRLNDGAFITAYFGHGSVTQWGRDRIFHVDDAQQLRNEILPIFLNFTCLTGFFIHPEVESLTEALLWQPDGGIAAALAPTSLTLPSDQQFLSNPLAAFLAEHRYATLGELLLAAQQEAMPQQAENVPVVQTGVQDVLNTFLLLGDPALRLFDDTQTASSGE